MKRIVVMLAAGLTAGAAFAETVKPAGDQSLADLGPGKVLAGITYDELAAVMTAAGFTATPVTDGKGFEVLAPGGYRFSAFLGDCAEGDAARCESLRMLSFSFNENANVTLKSINDWNTQSWGARGFVSKDGTSQVVMDVSLTGGVTPAWVTQQLKNFDYWMSNYGGFVGGSKPKTE